MNVPIPESWWVDAGRLLAGEYPGAATEATAQEKVDAFRDAGITSFVDLTEEGELEPYEHLLRGLTWIRLPIRDTDVPSPDEMRAILDRVDSQLARGEVVYVHCWGGHGRTGTVIGCWLVRHGMVPNAALVHITELRRGIPDAPRRSPEFDRQRELVQRWPTYDGPNRREQHGVR